MLLADRKFKMESERHCMQQWLLKHHGHGRQQTRTHYFEAFRTPEHNVQLHDSALLELQSKGPCADGTPGDTL